MNKSALLAFVALSTAVAVIAVASAADTCTAENGPVTCQTCKTGADVDIISSLPRLNAGGKAVSANLGAFDWFTCTNGDCTTTEIEIGISADSDTSPVSYIQSVALYSAFFVFLFVFTLLCGFCFCFSRLICCCKASCCGCGKCYPTRRSGCTGFKRDLDPSSGKTVFRYPACEVFCTRLYMMVFVLAIFVAIGMAQWKGNVATTSAMKTIATAPDGVMTTTRKMLDPITDLIIDVAGGTFVTAIRDVNATVLGAMSLPVVIDNLNCVVDTAVAGPAKTIPPLITVIDKVNMTIYRVNDVHAQVTSTITASNNVIDQGLAKIPGLITLLDGFEASRLSFQSSVNSGLVSIGAIKTALYDMSQPDVDVSSLITDLGKVADANQFPSQAQLDAAATGTDSLNTLITTDDFTGESNTRRDTLVSNLNAVQNKLAALPNITSTYYKVLGFLDIRQRINNQNVLPNLVSALQALRADIAALPLDSARASSIELQGILNDVTTQIVSMRSIIAKLQIIVDNAPTAGEITAPLNALLDVADVIPCTYNLINEIKGLNTTVLVLPDIFDDVTGLLDDVNATLSDAKEQVKNAEGSINDVGGDAGAFNMTRLNSTVNDLEQKKNNGLVELAKMIKSFTSVQAASNTTDLATPIGDAASFNNTLRSVDADVSASTLQEIWYAAQNQTELTSDLTAALAAVAVYASGHCDSDGSACSSTVPCGTGTCQYGVKKCSNDMSVTCGQDSDCGAGNTCFYNGPVFVSARNRLAAFVTPTVDTASFKAALESIDVSALNTTMVDGEIMLKNTREQLGDSEISAGKSTVQDVQTTAGDAKSQLNDAQGDFDTIRTAVNGVPDVQQIRQQLVSFNSTASQFTDQLDMLQDVQTVANNMNDFLFGDLNTILTSVQASSLRTAKAAGGVARVFSTLITAAVDVATWAETQAATLNNTFEVVSQLRDAEGDAMPYLNVLSTDSYYNHGAYYFALSLAQVETISPSEAGEGGSVFEDANGVKYPDDKLCLTTSCINTFIDFVNSGSFQDVSGDLMDTEIPIPLSRTMLIGLPFVLPLLAALCGCCAACGFCGKKWHRVPACFTIFCTCCLTPFIFLIVGGAVFPVVIVGSDVCYGGWNVGYEYLKNSEQSMCDSMGGVLQGSGNCEVTAEGAVFPINIPNMYKDFLGSCPGGNVWADIVTVADSNFIDYPAEQLNSTLDGLDSGIEPRPKMRAVLVKAANQLGQDLSKFIHGTTDVLSCEEINGDISALQNALCCDVMTAVYYSIAGWLWVAFAMCLCGCPAAVLGYKRFPRELWGTHFREDSQQLADRIRKAAKNQLGAYPQLHQQLVPLTHAGAPSSPGFIPQPMMGGASPSQVPVMVPMNNPAAGRNPMHNQRR